MFIDEEAFNIFSIYRESAPQTAMFFYLFAGADIVSDLDPLMRKKGFTIENGRVSSPCTHSRPQRTATTPMHEGVSLDPTHPHTNRVCDAAASSRGCIVAEFGFWSLHCCWSFQCLRIALRLESGRAVMRRLFDRYLI